MEKEGVASVWFGWAESGESIREFLMVRYTEEGDSIPSQFINDFGIDEYDKDFTEWTFHKVPTRLVRELLKRHSYSDQIIPKIILRVGETLPEAMNAVILMHQFEYDGSVAENSGGPVQMRFAGSVPFDPNVDL